MSNVKRKAVLYCRVSHTKQRDVGTGLDSQEHRCRSYAAAQGYEVEAVYTDDVTGHGDFMNRPGMVAVLKHLQDNPQHDYIVIFDDLKRFARDTIFHLKLRQALSAHNASVECLNFKFEETPEGRFVETVVAAQGELEREQNRRQTLQKMKARIERGYAVFPAPRGYEYRKTQGHGKMLVRVEPLASIIAEALEGYASGRFQIQAEVKRFLESHPEFPRDRYGDVRNQEVTNILTRPIYAGMVEAPEWGVSRRMGHHEKLIDAQTFQRIQERLNGKARVPARADINTEFPLRGAVICGCCGTPLTACFSKSGTGKRHPYYLCPKKGCEVYRKSVRRDVLESEFEALLKDMQPSKQLFELCCATFRFAWDRLLSEGEQRKRGLESELSKIERQVTQLLDRIVDAQTPAVVTAYEKRIQELEERKIIVADKIANCGRPVRGFDESLRTGLIFFANPHRLWVSGPLEHKRAVLRLAFADRLTYVRGEGLRTANLTLPFKLLADFREGKSKMAHRSG